MGDWQGIIRERGWIRMCRAGVCLQKTAVERAGPKKGGDEGGFKVDEVEVDGLDIKWLLSCL